MVFMARLRLVSPIRASLHALFRSSRRSDLSQYTLQSRQAASTSTSAKQDVGLPMQVPVNPVPGTLSRLERREAIRNAKPFSDFLTDSFNRQHDYLRISITERCNLRCIYCMPEEGVALSPSRDMLTTPEIVYLSSLFVSQGVTKIRLTGGEPTVRRDIIPLMQQLGNLRPKGLRELALTTNGIALHRKLDDMVKAGLTGVNLSLDTLDPSQFQIMTRRKGFDAVMKSIDRVLEMNKLGAKVKLKVNCVVMRGLNEREIIPFVELGREKNIEVRFIEYMPFGGNKWSEGMMIGFQEMLDIIRAKYPDLRRVTGHKNDTSKTFEIPGFVGRVGFITSMTNNFCGTCNRLRITGDGNLKVCLHDNTEVSLRDVLRRGNGDEPIGAEAFERIRQQEISNAPTQLGDDTTLGWGTIERELLSTIGVAVKKKAEKHADLKDLASMDNRPMILIDRQKPSFELRSIPFSRTSTLFSFNTPCMSALHSRALLHLPTFTVRSFSTSSIVQDKPPSKRHRDRVKGHLACNQTLKEIYNFNAPGEIPLPIFFEAIREKYDLTGPVYNKYWQCAAYHMMGGTGISNKIRVAKANAALRTAERSRELSGRNSPERRHALPKHKEMLREAQSLKDKLLRDGSITPTMTFLKQGSKDTENRGLTGPQMLEMMMLESKIQENKQFNTYENERRDLSAAALKSQDRTAKAEGSRASSRQVPTEALPIEHRTDGLIRKVALDTKELAIPIDSDVSDLRSSKSSTLLKSVSKSTMNDSVLGNSKSAQPIEPVSPPATKRGKWRQRKKDQAAVRRNEELHALTIASEQGGEQSKVMKVNIKAGTTVAEQPEQDSVEARQGGDKKMQREEKPSQKSEDMNARKAVIVARRQVLFKELQDARSAERRKQDGSAEMLDKIPDRKPKIETPQHVTMPAPRQDRTDQLFQSIDEQKRHRREAKGTTSMVFGDLAMRGSQPVTKPSLAIDQKLVENAHIIADSKGFHSASQTTDPKWNDGQSEVSLEAEHLLRTSPSVDGILSPSTDLRPSCPKLSDSLHLAVPITGRLQVAPDFTAHLDTDVLALQDQVFRMHHRLATSYPRLNSLPFDIWTSSNKKTLRTWLKIMISRWRTRFDQRRAQESQDGAPVVGDPQVEALLDEMVRHHNLGIDAAERMVKRWNEIFAARTQVSKDDDLDWSEFHARGMDFLHNEAAAADVVTNSEDIAVAAPQKTNRPNGMLLSRAKFGTRTLHMSARRGYMTQSRSSQVQAALQDKAKNKSQVRKEKTFINDQAKSFSPQQPSPSTNPPPALPHLTSSGTAHMVSVASKPHTLRTAIAVGQVLFSNPTASQLIKANAIKKGDVLSVARIAGIIAAKKCPDIVPLCHPIALTHVEVSIWLLPTQLDPSTPPLTSEQDHPSARLLASLDDTEGFATTWPHSGVTIQAKVQCEGQTGVEMEALTAVMGAALSVVDMCKAVDKGMRISNAQVVMKEGGKSGTWVLGTKSKHGTQGTSAREGQE